MKTFEYLSRYMEDYYEFYTVIESILDVVEYGHFKGREVPLSDGVIRFDTSRILGEAVITGSTISTGLSPKEVAEEVVQWRDQHFIEKSTRDLYKALYSSGKTLDQITSDLRVIMSNIEEEDGGSE